MICVTLKDLANDKKHLKLQPKDRLTAAIAKPLFAKAIDTSTVPDFYDPFAEKRRDFQSVLWKDGRQKIANSLQFRKRQLTKLANDFWLG